MKGQLPQHDEEFFEYNTGYRVLDNIAAAQELCDIIKPDAIIGHSLGGLIACHLTTDAKRIAISAPFGGSIMANFFPMLSQLMRDVATTSPAVAHFRFNAVKGPTLVFVARGLGNQGHDGVLSVSSQERVYGDELRFSHYDLNHYEVMVDDDICDEIAQFIF